jgi:predicted MPP superfamily phosphohydrolase
VLISFFVIYVPSRIIYDHNTVLIRTTEFNKSNIPDDLENFRIIFISDVQADRYTNNERLSNFIEKVNSTNPDLVLIAGDVITGGSDYINTSAEFIGKIKSKYGIYSCVGDHDNWAYRFDNARSRREITEALAAKNISMIDDDTLNIKINNAKIGITFITNTYVESIALTKLDRIASYNNDADLKIFLTHQPRQHLLDKAIEKNYDLFLAGHTHGGQITFLFPFYNLSPTLSETTYMRGDFYFGNLLMIVTRGLGMSLSPIRYNSTPEVTEIIIHKK